MDNQQIKKDFEDNGFVILRNLIPDSAISAYKEHYEKNSQFWKRSKEQRLISDWEYRDDIHTVDEIVNSFLHMPEIVNIVSYLMELKDDNSYPHLHLSLIPWVSTGQSWHYDQVRSELFGIQDTPHGRQVGAWIALDSITVESGPFGFIPKSNRIDYSSDSTYKNLKKDYENKLINEYKIYFSEDNKPFFKKTNEEVTLKFIMQHYSNMMVEYTDKCIDEKVLKDEMFIANAGDVLFWSGKTIHCAHRSHDGYFRKNIIGHYS
jgi:ectoine hydroxylase-related dioxygenase (phytanoyl-CoA dioxygenase family)